MARILIADDQAIIRQAITKLISKAGENWEICGSVDNGQSAVDEAARLKPDLVILDLRMPHLSGISAGRAIREMLPSTPVLIYTWVDASSVEDAVREAGLQGVVQKSEGAAILWAIRDLLAGKTAFSGDGMVGEKSGFASRPLPSQAAEASRHTLSENADEASQSLPGLRQSKPRRTPGKSSSRRPRKKGRA